MFQFFHPPHVDLAEKHCVAYKAKESPMKPTLFGPDSSSFTQRSNHLLFIHVFPFDSQKCLMLRSDAGQELKSLGATVYMRLHA